MKIRKRTWILLAVAVGICILSAAIQAIIQTDGFKVSVTMLSDAENSQVVLDENGSDKLLKGRVTSGALFVPKGASESNKLPAIVLTHGYLNNWQKQYQNCIELSRRGFVVVAVDRSGHGDYTELIGKENFGGTTADSDESLSAAGRYLYNLPYVDVSRIGVSGHSMGGFATSYALMRDKNDYYKLGFRLFSAGLIQAWDTFYGAADGVSVGILKSNDDEFFFDKVDPITGETLYTAREWIHNDEAKKFAGTTGEVISNHIYVNGADTGVTTGGITSTAGFRVVYEANEIHTLNHFSITSAGNVVNFFYTAFGVPTGYEYIAEGQQTWWVKEMFSAFGIVGFYMLFMPLADIMLALPIFASMRKDSEELLAEKAAYPEIKGVRNILSLVLSGLICTLFAGLMFRTITNYGASVWHVTPWFNQEHTNWIAYWCLVCGLFTLAVTLIFKVVNYFLDKRKSNFVKFDVLDTLRCKNGAKDIGKSLVLATAVFTATMLFVWLINVVFKVDFRLWLYTVKETHIDKIPTAIRYIPIFFVFYLVNSWIVSGSKFRNLPEWASVTINCVFNCLGIFLVFAIQYITFKSTGSLWHDDMGTRYPTILTIMPVLCVATVFSKKLYNKTGNAWTAAFLAAMIAAFGCVSGASASAPYAFI